MIINAVPIYNKDHVQVIISITQIHQPTPSYIKALPYGIKVYPISKRTLIMMCREFTKFKCRKIHDPHYTTTQEMLQSYLKLYNK